MSDVKPNTVRVPAEEDDPNHPPPTGDVITDHLVDDGLLVEAAAVDAETLAEAEDIEASEDENVRRLEAEGLLGPRRGGSAE